MITILSGFFSCILWGIGGMMVFIVLLWLLHSLLAMRISALAAIVAVVCAAGVFWESAQLAGGLQVRSFVHETKDFVQQLSGSSAYIGGGSALSDLAGQLPSELDAVTDIAEYYDISMSGSVQGVFNQIDKAVKSYLLARMCWLIGFLAVGLIGFMAACKTGTQRVQYTDFDEDLYNI